MKREPIIDSQPCKKAFESMNSIKIASWNVCGLRSLLKKNALEKMIESENPDMLCFNETMLQTKNVKEIDKLIPYYPYQYYACSEARKGYSGVAILTKTEPISVTTQNIEKHDREGRTLVAEFPSFFLISTYVPNVGAELKRMDYRIDEWDSDIRTTLNSYQNQKPVIWCGDFNVVHEDIDIYDIRGKECYGCCTPQERGSFRKTLAETRMIDTFRFLHPGEKAWSYFSRRNVKAKEKGQGWRIDYILASRELEGKISDAYTRTDIEGSDHHPVVAVFNLD
jgi:exodeoxyribonuclease-3